MMLQPSDEEIILLDEYYKPNCSEERKKEINEKLKELGEKKKHDTPFSN